MKKLFTLALLSILLISMTFSAAALNSNFGLDTSSTNLSSGNGDDELVDIKDVLRIEQLIQERNEMLSTEEINSERLDEIKSELRELGVRELDSDYVFAKCKSAIENYLGVEIADSRFTPPNTDGITWTSYRFNYSFRGTLYNIQVVESDRSTPNYALSTGECHVVTNRQEPQLQSTCRFAMFTYDILSEIYTTPISTPLKIIGSCLDFAKEMYGDHLTSQNYPVATNISYSITTQLLSTEKMIFIKYNGSPDEGYQCPAYWGNIVDYFSSFSYGCNVPDSSGTIMPQVFHYDTTGHVESQGLTDYNQMCLNYFNYRNTHVEYEYFDQIGPYIRCAIQIKDGNSTVSSVDYYLSVPSTTYGY